MTLKHLVSARPPYVVVVGRTNGSFPRRNDAVVRLVQARVAMALGFPLFRHGRQADGQARVKYIRRFAGDGVALRGLARRKNRDVPHAQVGWMDPRRLGPAPWRETPRKPTFSALKLGDFLFTLGSRP